jgi:hypothetical protein
VNPLSRRAPQGRSNLANVSRHWRISPTWEIVQTTGPVPGGEGSGLQGLHTQGQATVSDLTRRGRSLRRSSLRELIGTGDPAATLTASRLPPYENESSRTDPSTHGSPLLRSPGRAHRFRSEYPGGTVEQPATPWPRRGRALPLKQTEEHKRQPQIRNFAETSCAVGLATVFTSMHARPDSPLPR